MFEFILWAVFVQITVIRLILMNQVTVVSKKAVTRVILGDY